MSDILKVDERYYILATSSMADDRTRVLKHADTFAVFDRWGDIHPIGMGEQGLYHKGTRYLSSLTLALDGHRPLPMSSTIRRDDGVLAVDMMNPELPGPRPAVHGSLHLFRSKFLWRATCFEKIRVTNYALEPVAMKLALTFDCDWRDVFEVRGVGRERRGDPAGPQLKPDGMRYGYVGLDGVERWTAIAGDPQPDEVLAGSLAWEFELLPHDVREFFVTVACDPENAASVGWDSAIEEVRAETSAARARTCRISTSNPRLDDWILRSTADVHLLVTETEHGPYPYAGIPWFSTPFGRDGILTALELLWVDAGIARGVLSYLAATQATRDDPAKDAEPGKILHETRTGEMANLGEIPFGLYYGSVDATPLFVVLAAAYHGRTGDLAFVRHLWPHVEAAIGWLDSAGDVDADGFIEYESQAFEGLRNQGWKDSSDSVFHASGALAEPPIALCEVQGYAFAAWRGAARLARALGHDEQAAAWERRAKAMHDRFERAFWCEDLGTYALALDGEKRPCRVRTSNAGHALWSGIASPGRAKKAAGVLLSDRMFSGFGVRTVAEGEARYDPMSYHNGSVWPHDNALIALGLARYGFHREVERIVEGMYAASLSLDLHRMPELFCGFARREGEGPTLYPVACSPQAWSAAAVFAFLQACLGLSIDARRKQVHLEHARLPSFAEHVTLSDLRIRDARIDFALHRQMADVGVQILRREGDVEVVSVK